MCIPDQLRTPYLPGRAAQATVSTTALPEAEASAPQSPLCCGLQPVTARCHLPRAIGVTTEHWHQHEVGCSSTLTQQPPIHQLVAVAHVNTPGHLLTFWRCPCLACSHRISEHPLGGVGQCGPSPRMMQPGQKRSDFLDLKTNWHLPGVIVTTGWARQAGKSNVQNGDTRA